MKAIICDTCGKIAPDSFGVDIVPLTLSYNREPVKTIERDICPKCLLDLIRFFDPEQSGETAAEVTTLEPAQDHEFTPKEVKEISDIIVNSMAEALGGKVVQGESEPETEFKVVHNNDGRHLNFKAEEGERPDNSDPGKRMVICEYCKKEFAAKSKRSRFCTHYCENHDWMDRNKKKKQDELLAKLKRENPIREIKEPNIYREM